MFKSARSLRERAETIDRGLGRYAGRLSKLLWPWRERWLLLAAGALAVLDFTSTYLLLARSGQHGVYESGFLAGRALDRGGFPLLLLVDVLAAAVLSLAAWAARYLYTRHGCRDYGRAAFVLLLLPYIAIAGFAVVNNLVLLAR
jgi:hypothetical protein